MIESTSTFTPAQVAAHYDELDAFYRRIWGEHVHHGLWLRGGESREEAMRRMVGFVAEKARLTRGSRVADAGCGYGATARMLAEKYSAVVDGVTISRAQFEFALAHPKNSGHSGRVRFFCRDWLANDLPPEYFDAVIALESLEHMPDKRAFFSQAHRVLRSGGRLVVNGWLAHKNASARARRFLLEPICREARMPGIGTVRELREWARSAGFAVESIEDLSALVKKTWLVCVRHFVFHLLRHPRDARFLFRRYAQNRIFARTILRIGFGFATGALQYGCLVARKN